MGVLVSVGRGVDVGGTGVKVKVGKGVRVGRAVAMLATGVLVAQAKVATVSTPKTISVCFLLFKSICRNLCQPGGGCLKNFLVFTSMPGEVPLTDRIYGSNKILNP
jgi:hypothetical protein